MEAEELVELVARVPGLEEAAETLGLIDFLLKTFYSCEKKKKLVSCELLFSTTTLEQ